MEKAILKTLIYANIFDYPLKAYEIHKWLIGRKASLPQVEKALIRLSQESRQRRGSPKAARVKSQGGYYFLPKRGDQIAKRKRREKQSVKLLFKAKFCVWFLKTIPWVKLVGISGGLAMNNADKKDDIDLFIITAKNRIWVSRFVTLGILDLLGVRRKVKMKNSQITGKLCPNIIVEEDKLIQDNKEIFTAHEVLQMKALWQRNGIYSKYLMDNAWVFKFLPNWVGNWNNESRIKNYGKKQKNYNSHLIIHNSINIFENIAKRFQLKIMGTPKGMERIRDGALYFHPNDCRLKVLSRYKQKISRT